MTQNYSFLDLLCCAFEPLLKGCSMEAPQLVCEPMLKSIGIEEIVASACRKAVGNLRLSQ